MDTNNLPSIGIKPWLSIGKHYRLSLVLWVLVVVLGLPMVWFMGRSTYIAEAVFQVSPNFMKNLEGDKELEFQSNSQYREFVNHLSNTVTRYDVLQRALIDLKSRGIDTRPAALTERKYIERLQKTIYVRAIPDTYMVRIGKEDHLNKELADLINAITESFLKTTKTEMIYGSSERYQLLQENVTRLRAEVVAMGVERDKLASKLSLTTYYETIVNPFDQMMSQARDKITTASIERMQAEAALAAFIKHNEVPTSLGPSLLELRLHDFGLQALRNEVIRRTEELNRIVMGLAESHPGRKPALLEREEIKDRLQTKETEFDQKSFATYRSRLEGTLKQKLQVERDVKDVLQSYELQGQEFARNFQQAMRLTQDIKKRDQELNQLRDRLAYFDNETNAFGFARLVTPALPAIHPLGLGKTKLLLILLLLATGVAIVVPVAKDMLDRRIRSVNDAEKLMGFAAAGWQIKMEDLPTQLFGQEQYRRMAATLIRNKARHQRNCFSFTSVKPAGGTTTIVLDLARTMVQIGSRVLVVQTSRHEGSNKSNLTGPGLSEFLAGQAVLAGLPQTFIYQDCSLDLVSWGSAFSDGMRRIDLFKQAVAAWSDQYDYVLVDLPSILVNADAELLIETLGQVFLVVEADSVIKGEVNRAKRLLKKIDPEAVGLFVNQVSTFQQGGYFKALMQETITGTKYTGSTGLSQPLLWWQIWLARWSGRRNKK
ncbi:MAG: hypothetical protein WBI20_04505 [Burkholderiaceae bacterium]